MSRLSDMLKGAGASNKDWKPHGLRLLLVARGVAPPIAHRIWQVGGMQAERLQAERLAHLPGLLEAPAPRLLSEHGVCIPLGPDQVLQYLGVLRREGAARTTYSSVISALRFLEEAGEVAEADQLHSHPAVANLRQELDLATELAQNLSKASTDQAPAYPLRLLAASEVAVHRLDLPRYHCGHVCFTLLQHWSLLRWDDSQAMPPSKLERRTRGLAGLLGRTKTSGPGKAMKVFPTFAFAGGVGGPALARRWPCSLAGGGDVALEGLLPPPPS